MSIDQKFEFLPVILFIFEPLQFQATSHSVFKEHVHDNPNDEV